MYFLHAQAVPGNGPGGQKSNKSAEMLDIITVTSNARLVALRLLQG